MDDERERLLQAKELVGQKRYDEARAILHTMPNNPTAQKWLDQLDRVASTPPATAPSEFSAPSAAPPPPPAYQPAPSGPAMREEFMGQPAPQQRRRPALSDEQMEQARAQMQATLGKAGISLNMAVLTLLIALVAGLLAALLDALLGLPAGIMSFTFGGFAAVLAGLTYPMLRAKVDLGGLAVAAAAGLVTMLVWFILSEILIGDWDPSASPSAREIYKYSFNEHMNVLKALISGLLLGMAGFGWYALVPFLRETVQPFMPNLER